MNCDFSNPQVFYGGQMEAPASSTPDYAPVVFASSTCENSSSTGAIYFGGFSQGEIIISAFLFLLLWAFLFSFFVVKFFGIKIHKNV
jgi:hypothetical protein